jgi:hypothetical protein
MTLLVWGPRRRIAPATEVVEERRVAPRREVVEERRVAPPREVVEERRIYDDPTLQSTQPTACGSPQEEVTGCPVQQILLRRD